jgi:cytochrome c oxidase cbb3-type subunit 3
LSQNIGEKFLQNKNELRSVEADGIREYDNPMPRWWLGLFYVTIIFGIGYFAYFHMIENGGKSLDRELEQDMQTSNAETAKP